MIIEDDVLAVAKDFGLPRKFVAFAQAVVDAEGGGDHIIRAVQLSIPSVTTREQALRVVCRSIVHRICDYSITTNTRLYGFVPYFGSFWAPLGVQNDPTHLNENWVRNVTRLLGTMPDIA